MCGTERSGDSGGGGGDGRETGEIVSKDEVLGFSTNCSNCNAPAETRMKLLGILLNLVMYKFVHNSAHSHALEVDAYKLYVHVHMYMYETSLAMANSLYWLWKMYMLYMYKQFLKKPTALMAINLHAHMCMLQY